MSKREKYQTNLAKGLCGNCNRPARSGLASCEICAENRRKLVRELTLKRRSLGLCLNCGRPSIEGLSYCARCQERKRKHYARNKIRTRWYILKSRFGLSQIDYKNLYEQQNGICPVCTGILAPVDDGGRVNVIDHSHETGKIRGIVHRRCNSTVGFVENIGLDRIVGYIKAFGQ